MLRSRALGLSPQSTVTLPDWSAAYTLTLTDCVVGEPSTTLPLKVPGATTLVPPLELPGLLAAAEPAEGADGAGVGAAAALLLLPEPAVLAGPEPPPQPDRASMPASIKALTRLQGFIGPPAYAGLVNRL